jgi:hypothetical protein
VKSSYVRTRPLPSWWDDEAASSPAGFAELALLLAQRVRLPVAALLDKEASLSYATGDGVKFKLASGKDKSKLAVSQHLATEVARAALPGMRVAFRNVSSALDLRIAIIQGGRASVDLEGLLEHCWGLGVPVLPISAFPAGAVKMDGLAANIDGRPVIVISKASAQPAWLLYILAHEVGHIGSGHVGTNETLVDSDFDKSQEQDAEEDQANAYATSLLRGGGAKLVSQRNMSAEKLLAHARNLGVNQRIDPGHLILSYAREKSAKGNVIAWGVANRALGLLSPNADGPKIMREKLLRHLDWSALSDDVSEYIRRMTGIDAV